MKKSGIFSLLRTWLKNIPIQDPVDLQMAALLQVILIGFVAIFFLAIIVTLLLPSSTIPPLVAAIRLLVGSFVFGIPLLLLRRGHLRGAVFVVIAILLSLMTYAVFTATLRSIAENLAFFTLAIVLAGLLGGRTSLIVVFGSSAMVVLISAFRSADPALRSDEIAIAANFILLNGLMSVFINYFGITLRRSLRSSLEREEDLKREIDHRRQAEEKINILNQELQQQVAELERFTYTVSHDLRSPLVTIKGFLGLLNRDLQDNRPEKVQNDLQRIARATDKMDALLSELLELSRVGRLVNPSEEVDSVRLIQDALDSVDARLRSKNVTVNILPDLPKLYGDRIRLREVFENLLDNAAKYMGDQTTPVIEIGAREQGKETAFYVKDNGMGIDPAYQSRIFNIFEKLNPASEGTGIGLTLVKRIIETHGGSIWVESEGAGKGTTFYFTIPMIANT